MHTLQRLYALFKRQVPRSGSSAGGRLALLTAAPWDESTDA